jgi:anion-transporting  ArsA/GET3 family ATPase
MDMRGNLLASSKVIDKDVQVEKYSEKTLDAIYFELGTVSLAKKVPTLLNEFRTTGALKIISEIITKIDNRIPIAKKEELIIGSIKA